MLVCKFKKLKTLEKSSNVCGLLQIYELYSQRIFCLPHIFDLCLHWVSIVRGADGHGHQKKLEGG